MSLSDALPETGKFSVEVLQASLGFKGSVVTKEREAPVVEGEEGEEDGGVEAAAVEYIAPSCYCKLKLSNAAGCFEEVKAKGYEEGEAEGADAPSDTTVTVTSEASTGEGEGPTFFYSFNVKVASKEKLKILSGLVSDALVNDGGEIEVFKVGSEEEKDEKLGGGSFGLAGGLSGGSAVIKMGEVPPAPEKVEEKAEEGGEGGEEKKEDGGTPAAEGTEGEEGAEAVLEEPKDTSPGSLAEYGSTSQLEIKVNVDDNIADYTESGSTVAFSNITVNNVPADVFGVEVAVDEEVDNDEYMVKLQEKLGQENDKWSYECILERVGRDLVVGGGLVEFVKDSEEAPEEEAKEEGEPEAEVDAETKADADVEAETKAGGDEEGGKIPAPVVRPTGKFNLVFSGTSKSSFMTYQEGKALKKAIKGGDEFMVKFVKKINPNAAPAEEEAAAPAKGKKGNKGKEEKKEEEVMAAPVVEDWEGSVTVSLGSLVGPGATNCVVEGTFEEETVLVGEIDITSPLVKEDAAGKGDGEERVKSVAGGAYTTYQHSLDRDMFHEFKEQLDASVDQLVEEFAELFLLNESATANMG